METIYAENYYSVERYVVSNSGTDDDAKDVYQEAIVAAWINAKEGKFETKTDKSIGGYIFQIAKYKWLDRLKSAQRKATARLVKENLGDPAEDEYTEEQEQRMDKLNELYSKLDEKCKQILNRFYYQKCSLEEIGELLGYDTGTVKTLKYRCMKKLRKFHNA